MKTENQELNVYDLLEWRSTKVIEYAGSYGKGSNKSLVATLNGSYKVYHNGGCILECVQPYKAIEAYNDLP